GDWREGSAIRSAILRSDSSVSWSWLDGARGKAGTWANSLLRAVHARAKGPAVVVLVHQSDNLTRNEFQFVAHRGLEFHNDSVNREDWSSWSDSGDGGRGGAWSSDSGSGNDGCIRKCWRSWNGAASEGIDRWWDGKVLSIRNSNGRWLLRALL